MKLRVIEDERDPMARLRQAAGEYARRKKIPEKRVEAEIDTKYHGWRSPENRPETDAEREERARLIGAQIAQVRQWGAPGL